MVLAPWQAHTWLSYILSGQWDSTSYRELGPSALVNSQDGLLQMCPRAHAIWVIGLGLSSQVTVACINLTVKTNQDRRELPGCRGLEKKQQGLF